MRTGGRLKKDKGKDNGRFLRDDKQKDKQRQLQQQVVS
jgi:hypothetical protein